jgi:predicted small metal-binding protein
MTLSISCRELGIACDFLTSGETGEAAIDSLMCHVEKSHAEDWFEIEEIYQVACRLIREKAA